jgi:hypothetical protein
MTHPFSLHTISQPPIPSDLLESMDIDGRLIQQFLTDLFPAVFGRNRLDAALPFVRFSAPGDPLLWPVKEVPIAELRKLYPPIG